MKEAGHTRYPLCRGSWIIASVFCILRIFSAEKVAEADPLDLKRTIAVFEIETLHEEPCNGCYVRSSTWPWSR